jgi:hypothetical protein
MCNPRYFNDFKKKYIKQSNCNYSYQDLVNNPPVADIYVAGSDQIWNTFHVSLKDAKDRISAYCLNFGPSSVKRIAYAASFGKVQFDNEQTDFFTPLLKSFDFISVREKSGIDICHQCGVENVDWAPDPVMLLDANIFRGLYKIKKMKQVYNGPYIFIYKVGVSSKLSITKIRKWAEKKNLGIVYISGNNQYDKYKKVYATIPEWIYLLDNAGYVFTNSFHASVFSLIFHKRFAVMPIVGKLKDTNNRFVSLFEQFGIKSRFVDFDFDLIENNIDWGIVEKHFAILRNGNRLRLKEYLY